MWPFPDEVQDPFERNEPGKGVGRDPQRTPMQWDASVNAGFTTGHPWLRLGDDWATRNVAALEDDPQSMLTLYRRLMALRRQCGALASGAHEAIVARDHVFAFARSDGSERVVIVVNFGAEPVAAPAIILPTNAVVLISTHMDRAGAFESPRVLRGNEGPVIGSARLTASA